MLPLLVKCQYIILWKYSHVCLTHYAYYRKELCITDHNLKVRNSSSSCSWLSASQIHKASAASSQLNKLRPISLFSFHRPHCLTSISASRIVLHLSKITPLPKFSQKLTILTVFPSLFQFVASPEQPQANCLLNGSFWSLMHFVGIGTSYFSKVLSPPAAPQIVVHVAVDVSRLFSYYM